MTLRSQGNAASCETPLLRSRQGRPSVSSGEDITLPRRHCRTRRGLVEWLKRRGGVYAEALSQPGHVRVAVNQAYGHAGTPVTDDDEVALFPPVTGG